MLIFIPFDIDLFKKELQQFKNEKHSGEYVGSIGFELEVHVFWDLIEKEIKQQVENKTPDALEAENDVKKTLEKIKYSPAGFSLNKFGLGELLKNAAEPGLDITRLNFFIILNEEKAALEPNGIIIIVIDNGRGFAKSYLNKDVKKLQDMSNVRAIKDPAYVEGKIEDKEVVIERKKTLSNKLNIDNSLGGKGIGLVELAKTVTIYKKDQPSDILGRMLVGNIEDFDKTSFKSLLSNVEDFKLPKQGAVTIVCSPYYSEDLIKVCESSFSKRYKEFITNISFAERAEKNLEPGLSSLSQLSTVTFPPILLMPPNQPTLSAHGIFPKVNFAAPLVEVSNVPHLTHVPRAPLSRERRNKIGIEYLRRK